MPLPPWPTHLPPMNILYLNLTLNKIYQYLKLTFMLTYLNIEILGIAPLISVSPPHSLDIKPRLWPCLKLLLAMYYSYRTSTVNGVVVCTQLHIC